MKTKNNSLVIISNALVWAGAILITAPLMEDPERQNSVVMGLIAAWFAAHLYLSGGGKSAREEWTCLRRRFGASNER